MPDLKVTAHHLRRDAYLCFRQSTLRQVAGQAKTNLRGRDRVGWAFTFAAARMPPA